jgi:hypothetical protein
VIRRRGRFAELVDRQLALFLTDEAMLLDEADAALVAWRDAGREDAEEAYGDYQLVADAIADRLLELREAYAATLPEDADADYRLELARAVARQLRAYPSVVTDLAVEP